MLPEVPEEKNLVLVQESQKEFWLYPRAAENWIKMQKTAREEGIVLKIISAYRSIERQEKIVEAKRKKGLSEEEIFRFSAPPGFSEHHSGRAIDITTDGVTPLEEEFEKTKAFKWLTQNASRFSFRMSYPRKNEYGLGYEPWHWVYFELTQPVTENDDPY
ncbi:MAG: D-alanyl-D-alanine carboxypeptidase family protein [Puniceicoccaceae bacterium]